jgi:hypothetical protein
LEPGVIERLRALVEDDAPLSSRAALPSFAGAGI